MQTLAFPNIEGYILSTEDCNNIRTELDYSIDQKSEVILKLIQNYSKYSTTELEDLYKVAINSPYTEVVVYLLEQKNDYNKCFVAFLQCNTLEIKKKVFDWLGLTFKKLANNDLESLKAQVVDSLNLLVEIDSDRTAKLVKE